MKNGKSWVLRTAKMVWESIQNGELQVIQHILGFFHPVRCDVIIDHVCVFVIRSGNVASAKTNRQN